LTRLSPSTLPLTLAVGAAWLALASANARAFDDRAAGVELFEKRVRPVLIERCAECHAGEEPESGLAVDSLAGLLRGGTRGAAIVPGKPNDSLLVSAVRHGELLKMPPRSKLAAAEIADIARWVELGAPWPGEAAVAVAAQSPADVEPPFEEMQREFWSFRTPVRPAVPVHREWVRSPIDAFVLARLDAAGLSPAPPADRRTLIRRVTFDLLGLPPTPEEVAAFVADESPDALLRLVDRLLASPHYGERWGRR
jgi:mono/diheme cytochrome c family protein